MPIGEPICYVNCDECGTEEVYNADSEFYLVGLKKDLRDKGWNLCQDGRCFCPRCESKRKEREKEEEL